MTAETCSISSSVVSSLELLEDDDDVAADRLVEGPGTGEDGGEEGGEGAWGGAWGGTWGGAPVGTRGRGGGEGVGFRAASLRDAMSQSNLGILHSRILNLILNVALGVGAAIELITITDTMSTLYFLTRFSRRCASLSRTRV